MKPYTNLRKMSMLVFLFLAASAANAGEPLALKGLMLGDPPQKVRAVFPAQACSSDTSCFYVPNTRSPSDTLETFASTKIEYISTTSIDGQLVSVRIKLPMSGVLPVSNALLEKFGKVTPEIEEFQTKGGLHATKRTWTWIDGDAMLRAVAPSGSINEMMVTLTSKAYMLKRVEELKSKAKSDL